MRTRTIHCLVILLLQCPIAAFGTGLFWFTESNSRTATNKPYEEIELDSIQECIIKSEIDMSDVYSSSNDKEPELSGLCIRAFSVWVRKYTGDNDLQVKVFTLNSGFRDDKLLSPDEFSDDEYDEDEAVDEEEQEREKKRKYAKEYYENVPFDYIEPYPNYDLDSLLSRKVALINVTSSYSIGFSDISIIINAVFPNPDDVNSYLQYTFDYTFRLRIEPNTRSKKNMRVLRDLFSDPYYLINSDDSVFLLPLLADTSWDLFEFNFSEKPTKYTEQNLPKTLYELFLGAK